MFVYMQPNFDSVFMSFLNYINFICTIDKKANNYPPMWEFFIPLLISIKVYCVYVSVSA